MQAQPTQEISQDRAASFEATQGGGNMQSGEMLLIEAYALIWMLLMGYVLLLWRKQKSLHARLDDLEKAIDRAAEKRETAKA